jgi:hypothetical protein
MQIAMIRKQLHRRGSIYKTILSTHSPEGCFIKFVSGISTFEDIKGREAQGAIQNTGNYADFGMVMKWDSCSWGQDKYSTSVMSKKTFA